MIKDLINKLSTESNLTIGKDGSIISISPETDLFGLTYHAYMIPPFKPSRALGLGACGFTVDRLIQTVWGNVNVYPIDSRLGKNAEQFLNESDRKFDYIYVDLWDGGVPNDIVFDKKFVEDLRKCCDFMVSVNTAKSNSEKFMVYYDNGFDYVRHVEIGDNIVIWWVVK